MQKLFEIFAISSVLLPLSLVAFTAPIRPIGFVQDYAGMLSSEQVASLESRLEAFEKNTTNEIAVVTIPSLDGDTVENVAQDIFTKWGIGKKDKNNGVLLLISLGDRKTRIHTGYGIEGDLTDLATSYIQQDIITPAFRAGDYYSGINSAVDKMIEVLGGSQIVPENYSSSTSKIPWNFLFISFIIFIQIVSSILARSKSWWGGGVLGGGIALLIWHFFIASLLTAVPLVVILILLGLLFDYSVSRAYTQGKATGHYPWWFGGGGFGGGHSGGGFGGFGGGGSGGGGSNGSW
ncbi:MAG: TPM domain-containing protein [Minisyncoccia bacterium]